MKTKLILMVLSVVFTMVSSTSTCSAQNNLKKFGRNWHCYGEIGDYSAQIAKPFAIRHEYRNGSTEVYDFGFHLTLLKNSFKIEVLPNPTIPGAYFPFWDDVTGLSFTVWGEEGWLTSFQSEHSYWVDNSSQGTLKLNSNGEGLIWSGLDYRLLENLLGEEAKTVVIWIQYRHDIGKVDIVNKYDIYDEIRLRGEGFREALKCVMDSRY